MLLKIMQACLNVRKPKKLHDYRAGNRNVVIATNYTYSYI